LFSFLCRKFATDVKEGAVSGDCPVASDESFVGKNGPSQRHPFDSAAHELAAELDLLVNGIEAEMRDTGSLSVTTAERVHELRLRLERLSDGGMND
jgi:hypothetical protein